MNRYHRALVGVVLLGAVTAIACSEDSPSPTPATSTPTATPASTGAPTATATTAAATSTPTSAATAAPTATPTPTATAGGVEVRAPIGGFVLPTLTVDRGTTVIWSNQDGVPHTATADDGEFDSGILDANTFSHTFEESGTFSYFCEVHPTMTATITVN